MIRILAVLLAVLCCTIVMAEAVGIGYLWSQGHLTALNLYEIRLILTGKTETEKQIQTEKAELAGVSRQETQTARVMRILDRAGKIAQGSITFSGIDVRDAPEKEMRDLRGREMSMIFQSPRAALNPIRRVGHQIEDVLKRHAQATSNDAKAKAIAMLEQVRIARPEDVVTTARHQRQDPLEQLILGVATNTLGRRRHARHGSV